MNAYRFHEFLQTRLPWRLGRLYYTVPARVGRSARRLRFLRPPAGGWGQGWRVLVFRVSPGGHDLHVLAPVNGLELDQELLRLQIRGEIKPDHVYRGARTAEMAWGGHHIYVVNDEIGAQRIPMSELILGEFRGGAAGTELTLVDVRAADIAQPETMGR